MLLFGGSFDPVHPGHVAMARAARDGLFGDAGHAVFVPAARSPHKGAGPIASGADRVRMLELAIEGDRRAHVWRDEIARGDAGEPSYWVDTLRRARRVAGDCELRFLIGADQVVAFHRWREPDAITALAEPAVVLREPLGTRAALAAALRAGGQAEYRVERWIGRIVETPLHAVSSTAVRVSLDGPVAPRLDASVAAYIRERGLYARR